MSIRQNLPERLRLALQEMTNTPTKRYGAGAVIALVLLLIYTLLNPTPPAKQALPHPIVQGQQLRFPAGHPQLALLETTHQHRTTGPPGLE